MRRMCIVSAIVMIGLVSMPAAASVDDGAAAAADQFTFTLYLDNDSPYFMPDNDTDRYYTHGTKLTVTHHPKWGSDLAQTLRRIIPIGGDESMKTAVGYVAGQEIYTPEGITIAAPQPNDRPWAGWLYGGVYLQRAVGDRVFDHFELNIGVVGPSSLADEGQEWIHDWLDADTPAGWSNQLPDEFGIDFIYRRKWKFTLVGENNGDLTIEAIPQAGLTLGNVHRDFGADVTLRAGVHLPTDFGPGRLEDVLAATGGKTHPWGVYGFVRTGGRYVAHDMFIEGTNDHRGVPKENWVGEIQAGANVYWKHFELGWSVRWVSEQFKAQPNTHAYGTWMLSYATTF